MKIFRQSLRSKLIGVFLVPTLVIVALYGFLAYFASRQGLEEELGRRLVSIGQVLSSRMSEGIDASQIARLDKTKQRVLSRLRADLQQAKAATGVRRIYLFDRSHDLIVDTAADHVFGQRAYELEIHNVEIERVFEHGTPAASVLFEGPDGLLYKTGFVPVTDEGVPIAALGVEADADYFELLTNFASVLTVLALLSVFLVILAGTVLGRRLVEPINRLVIAAERLGGGQLEEPVQGTGGADEIAFLGQAFEEMRQRLVSRDRQLQMMLSGIAHEVRNPLGGMELFCGLLTEDLRQLDLGGDEAHMLEKVARIQRELDYLEAVVTDFLDFARKAAPDRERFRADTFMADIDDLLRGEVVEAGCALQFVCEPADVELTADPQKLRRAVINVVRNAYQACGAGGHVEVRVEEVGEGPAEVVALLDAGDDAARPGRAVGRQHRLLRSGEHGRVLLALHDLAERVAHGRQRVAADPQQRADQLRLRRAVRVAELRPDDRQRGQALGGRGRVAQRHRHLRVDDLRPGHGRDRPAERGHRGLGARDHQRRARQRVEDVLAVFAGSDYTPQVAEEARRRRPDRANPAGARGSRDGR